MRRPLIVSALLAAAIALTGCSTGASAQDAGVSDKSAEVLSVANIDKVKQRQECERQGMAQRDLQQDLSRSVRGT